METNVYRETITTIRELTRECGSTPEQLAAAAFIEPSRMLDIFSRRGVPVTLVELLAIAGALDVEPSDLIPSTVEGELP